MGIGVGEGREGGRKGRREGKKERGEVDMILGEVEGDDF